jgi:hypothetical protein
MVRGLGQVCGNPLTCRCRHEEGSFGEPGGDFWPLADGFDGFSVGDMRVVTATLLAKRLRWSS